jgi:hypothetical protein
MLCGVTINLADGRQLITNIRARGFDSAARKMDFLIFHYENVHGFDVDNWTISFLGPNSYPGVTAINNRGRVSGAPILEVSK